MKRIAFIWITILTSLSIFAQSIDIVGTWNEEGEDRTWIFHEDGTKSIDEKIKMSCPIGEVDCTFELILKCTDEKWTLNDNVLTTIAIPLDMIFVDVDYEKYENYTNEQKQKIKAALPAFKQLMIEEVRKDWKPDTRESCVITSFTPKQMILVLDDNRIVLNRDLSKLTPTQKAKIEKDMQDYISHKETKQPLSDLPQPTNDDDISDVVDQKPSFPGGQSAFIQWLSSNIKYPESLAKSRVEGRVVVQFVVEKDGSLSNISVINNSVDPLFDKEALRVVQMMPKWIPGKLNGSVVRVKYSLPITFKL